MRKGKLLATSVLCTCLVAAAAWAQDATPVPSASASAVPSEPKLLDTVVVSGRVAGPGLWQVYRDEDHDLWIMGTLSPHPADIEWDATEVRALVARSQEVLWAPRYSVNVDANLLQQAMLGIGYLRAKKNPDGQSLKDVLPPDLYARWVKAKAKYLPHDSGVERKRPLIAAQELFAAAVKRANLSSRGFVYPAMQPTIEENGIKSTIPRVQVDITNQTAKAALADMRGMQLDDRTCLAATLDAVETDIPRMVSNANAWANGQVSGISFASLQRRDVACSDALMRPEFSAKYGLPNIKDSVEARWLSEAAAALARNASTVAFVPMENLIGPGSYLDRLRAQGYTVSGP